MKIVKKLKGVISWHFYNDDEINLVMETVLNLAEGNADATVPVLTNLFKGSDGDEVTNLYLITSQDENRLYIDNEQKKLILNIRFEDLTKVITVMQGFLKDKKTPTADMLQIFIAKKEYMLVGFNQQYKRWLKPKKNKNPENKPENKENQ